MDEIFADQIRDPRTLDNLYEWHVYPYQWSTDKHSLHQEGLGMTMRKQPVCQTQKMCLLGKESRLPRNEGKITMDPIKLRGIKDWSVLTTIKELQQFLGFANYYWQFIWGYGNLMAFPWTPYWRKLKSMNGPWNIKKPLTSWKNNSWTPYWRKLKSTNRPQNVKKPLTPWKNNLWKHWYCICLTRQNPLSSKQTPQNRPLEQCLDHKTAIETGTPVDICQSPSQKWNEIMT